MITAVKAPAWRSKAACKGASPELFFPDGEDWRERGKEVARDYCGTCEVRMDCRAWAYQARIPYGVWGGRIFGIRSWKPDE